MNWKVPLFKIYWDDRDIATVRETIQRGMFWAIGPNIRKFEEMLADYLGTKYALVFNSGTSALHAILIAYGLKEGDEVIVPSFTFIATANAPLFVGTKPVFADIEVTTYGLDPEDVRRKITPKTKAIIPIHYGGSPCLILQLKGIADENNLILIEDAAESLGAEVEGKKVGHFGDAAILSFCSNKVISTGEGGAVVTDSTDIFNKLSLVRSHGREENANYFDTTGYMDYVTLGYNFRMSDITAGLGVSQLEKIGSNIKMRQNNAKS
jgi:perosamine synthetase